MTLPGLFDGPAPRLRAAPASAPFLELLAGAMADALYREDDPFALSDALVLLPNRRAARGLVDAFAKRLGGAALLPTIRPLGDPYADDDPDVWGAETFETPPQIPKMRRRMELASLIRRRDKAQNGVEDPARALALADELAKLLDSAATVERVAWEKLKTLVEDIDLARHWEASARFLDIIATYWPQHLKEEGLSDFAVYGADLRKALTARWRDHPPTRPIVIAGSTGSIATTRDLMRVVAGLPRGVVVLPGVDIDLDDASWDTIGDQHPQHALKETLAALGVDRRSIAPLGEATPQGRARRVLMREALAPAEQTADWLQRLDLAGGDAFVRDGVQGLRLLEAQTEDDEATAIALMLREALETPGRTAALATPDAALALRVEAKLARWGVQPAVSHGRPLMETEAGALIALLCELARDPAEPVALAALMKHPRARVAGVGARTALEHLALRGPRRHDTLRDLAALDTLQKVEFARELVGKIEGALEPLTSVMSRREISLRDFADAVTETAEHLGGGAVWQGADGDAVAKKVLAEAINHGEALGLMRAADAPRVLMKLLEPEAEPRAQNIESRIAIWGTLEARLQRRDLMILGGLNEGVWPAAPGEDPFLSRPMRTQLGLPSLDERIGLAAHDFAQLANAPDVVLTRSLRRDGSPTLASRWLWRLKTLVQGAKAEIVAADAPLAWTHVLNKPGAQREPIVPRPKPPVDKRIKRLSVTQVETLIRDPYALYARRILRLEVLKPIGAEAGPAERGSAVHKAIERFEDGDEHGLLVQLLDEELTHAGVSPERRAAERERLMISVKALIAWFAERRARNATIHREKKGVLTLDGGVELSGVADRIEIGPGHVAILDFKTGAPPTDKQVDSGLSPQLPLEAAMLARGVFEDVPTARVTELVYWRFGNADPTPRALDLEEGPAGAGEGALRKLQSLLNRYAQPEQAFLSKPRVLKVRLYDDYDQLARRKEWADAEGDE